MPRTKRPPAPVSYQSAQPADAWPEHLRQKCDRAAEKFGASSRLMPLIGWRVAVPTRSGRFICARLEQIFSDHVRVAPIPEDGAPQRMVRTNANNLKPIKGETYLGISDSEKDELARKAARQSRPTPKRIRRGHASVS